MRKLAWILLLVPGMAVALTYERSSLLYVDAPFSPAEAAGISVLTTLGSVQGYPDGSFHPERTLNRAEFLKIALASHPDIRVSASDAARCFPDVGRDDWFSPYVCLAKKRGIIAGYPDGDFKPGNSVNYAEALKILGELYEYTAYAEEGAEWWQMYVQAAMNHKTILPVQLTYDRYITRGQMARLAAAYRAEHEGELDLYRKMENGETVVRSSSSSSSTSESSSLQSSTSSSSSSSSSSSVETSMYVAPTTSKILLIGKSHAIGDAMLYPQQKDAHISIVKVKLDREARSLRSLSLATENGTIIGTMKLDLYDNDNETWAVEIDNSTGGLVLPAGQGTRVFVVANIKDWNSGGFAEDRIKVQSLYVVLQDVADLSNSYQVVPSDAHYPAHQTALAKVTAVESALTGTGNLVDGNNQLLAAFRFRSQDVGGVSNPKINHLRFYINKSTNTTLSNIKISSDNSFKFDCSMDSSDSSIVNCLNLPDDINSFENNTRTIEFHANVSAGTGAYLQVKMLEPGSLSLSGDVRFTDGSADFNWIDLPAPLAASKYWQK